MSGYAFHSEAFSDLNDVWEFIAEDEVQASWLRFLEAGTKRSESQVFRPNPGSSAFTVGVHLRRALNLWKSIDMNSPSFPETGISEELGERPRNSNRAT